MKADSSKVKKSRETYKDFVMLFYDQEGVIAVQHYLDGPASETRAIAKKEIQRLQTRGGV